jgi:hypothetical protein
MALIDYLNLITQQHRDKPKFMATVEADVYPYVYIQEVVNSFTAAFEIATAVGDQLDIIAEWVGITRDIPVPLTDVYFEWDDAAQPTKTGWDFGSWKGAFDPASGMQRMNDDLFRKVIRGKIFANSWIGDLDGIYIILFWTFGLTGTDILVVDNHDMTMTVDTVGLSAIEQAVLDQNLLPIKPSGVSITYSHT